MEEREEEFAAPGPLVPASDLLPAVSYESKIDLSDLEETSVPVLYQVVGWCSLVIVFAMTMRYASLIQAMAVFGLGLAGGWYWLMRENPRKGKVLRVAKSHALRAELGDFRVLIAELEQQTVNAENGYERYHGLHDLGYYELRSGNYERALVCLSESYRWILKNDSDATGELEHTGSNLATTYLLMGDIASAQAWLPLSKEPTLTYGKILSLARSADYVQVLEQGDYPNVHPSVKTLLAHTARVFSLMQCFARSKLGQDDVDQAELDAARPVSASEYTYLCTNWPELAEFVATLPIKERKSVSPIPKARVLSDGS